MAPIFLLGILLGYLRSSSGSLLPPILLHMGFNAVPFFDLFGSERPAAGQEPGDDVLQGGVVTLAAAVWAAIVAAFHVVATRSDQAAQSRQSDVTPPPAREAPP
jgi:membrane protease YdiL (CAAX protease family)